MSSSLADPTATPATETNRYLGGQVSTDTHRPLWPTCRNHRWRPPILQFLECFSAPILEDRSRSGADPHPTDTDLKREESVIHGELRIFNLTLVGWEFIVTHAQA